MDSWDLFGTPYTQTKYYIYYIWCYGHDGTIESRIWGLFDPKSVKFICQEHKHLKSLNQARDFGKIWPRLHHV